MPIRFLQPPGTLLLCDYGLGGFIAPEMVKRRPAIVISPRLPHRDNLCAVVPLSTSEPDQPVAYAVRLDLTGVLPAPFARPVCWAKCDMLATVSLARLDLFRTGRDHTGKRRYLTPKLSPVDFARVLAGIFQGLGLD